MIPAPNEPPLAHRTVVATIYNHDEHRHQYRAVCTTCQRNGLWRLTPVSAERDAIRHERRPDQPFNDEGITL